MNNPEHLNYRIDKNRLRIGAALGVIVITAGFALGSIMNTSSSSADEPIPSEIDSTTAANETTVTDNGSDQDSENASSTANDQPVADKGSVANETDAEDTDETDAEDTDETDAEDTDETDAEDTDETDSDEENNSGLGWDFGLVFPGDILDELIDPLPLPDDLGPIGPINPPSPPSPINPPSPPSPINPPSPPSPIGYDTGPIGTPSPIDPLIQMWSELSGHIN